MFIDTHTHLDLVTDNENEIQKIIKICKKSRISALFNISVDHRSNFNSLRLAKKHKEIYFTCGLHPSEADHYTVSQINDILPLIDHEKCVGIGEVGIDLFKNYSKVENQMELFERFLNIAKGVNKPVIIHSRNAFKEVFRILNRNEYKDIKGVFHCYSYGYAEAKKCIDHGFYISFAGNLTYKNAVNLHETAVKIPMDHILCETDSPFLAPVPVRGEKNYPYHLIHLLKFLSKLKGVSMINLEKYIYKNIARLFKL
ncbi:MAG: TatD family hydrolase [Spirochaetes bacterium]|nr:TatD family hydrolase [Spirochaetota bacterium]